MRTKFYSFAMAAIACLVTAAGCGKDDIDDGRKPGGGQGGGPSTETVAEQRNKWIYSQVSEWYLWREDVLAKKPNYKEADHEKFFKSLLSTNREDGHDNGGVHRFYSYIDRFPASTRTALTSANGFGLEFRTVSFSNSDDVAFMVTYTVPGSPAYNAGIRRGHVIMEVNGVMPTIYNYKQLYPYLLSSEVSGISPRPVVIGGVYFTDPDDLEGSGAVFRDVRLSPANVLDNPVHFSKIIELNDGRKAGYIVYNRFESGYPDIVDSRFNDDMKRVFREFQNARVDELIIDMRYNPGGLTSCALLMASMINNSYNGEVFNLVEYNELVMDKYFKGKPGTENILTATQMKKTMSSFNGKTFHLYGKAEGANLGLDRIFVLTSKSTASSSELIINGMKGLIGDDNVIVVGEKTIGKSVGMTLCYKGGTFGGYSYELWPVSYLSKNRRGERTPIGGWQPNAGMECNELEAGVLYPFGDRHDPLLGKALDHIEGRPATKTVAPAARKMVDLFSSHEMKRGGMVEVLYE